MKKLKEIRENIYNYNYQYYPYIFKWPKYSYRRIKAILYLEVCPVIVYLFIITKIKPNVVTLIYGIMGIIGGIFLAIPVKSFIFIGVLLFFFRPFLDWSDGALAREIKETSLTGEIFDSYCSYAGWIPLWTGLGIYVANKSGTVLFYYTALIIPIIFALDIFSFAKVYIFEVCKIKGNCCKTKNNDSFLEKKKTFNVVFIKRLGDKLFEHNARTVDFICLIIILEMFWHLFISWIIFTAFFLWQTVKFIVGIYVFAKGGWIEEKIKGRI